MILRGLAFVFLAMAFWGVLIGHLGGAVLAVFMWALMHYAHRVFALQDQVYYSDPERAPVQASTSDALQAAESECMADKV